MDTDQDEICDIQDNCPNDYNPFQEDFNNDQIGDACDGINVEENLTKINLIQVVDVLGRELNPNTKYKSLLYIYDDGSIRKQFIIK